MKQASVKKTEKKSGSKAIGKISKTKTAYDKEGLELAVYVANNFSLLEEVPVDLKPKSVLRAKIQKYLDRHIGRMVENKLRGIICVRDSYRNSTGGRVHLIAGLEGPVVEAIQRKVVEEPIDYEEKSKYFLKVIEAVSESKAPKAGKIHFHLFFCNQIQVLPITILDFLRREHGFQNELQQRAPAKIDVLVNIPHKPFWRKNVDSKMIQALFGKSVELR